MKIKPVKYHKYKYYENEKISRVYYGDCPIFGQIDIYYNNNTKLYEPYYRVVHFEDDDLAIRGIYIHQYDFKFKNQFQNLEEYECKTLEECIHMIEQIREGIILDCIDNGK